MFLKSELARRTTRELLDSKEEKKRPQSSQLREDMTRGQILFEKLAPTVDKDIRLNPPSLLIWKYLSDKSRRMERN